MECPVCQKRLREPKPSVNERKANELGLRARYYYLRERAEDGNPLPGGIVVSLLCDEQSVVARGASVCSPLDPFMKRVGRAKALGRAVQAVERGSNVGRIHGDGRGDNDWLKMARVLFGHYGCFAPTLTTYEQHLVAGLSK